MRDGSQPVFVEPPYCCRADVWALRKPPAFFSHPVALLEAPAWLVSVWLGLYC